MQVNKFAYINNENLHNQRFLQEHWGSVMHNSDNSNKNKIGPSEVHATSEATYWSEQSVWDQRSNLGRPLFLVFFFLSLTVTILPEGAVLWLWNFAWAPYWQKYKDSNQQHKCGDPHLAPLAHFLGF